MLRRYGLMLPVFLFAVPVFSQAPKARLMKGPVPSWVQPFSYDSSLHPPENDIDGGEYLAVFEAQRNLDQQSVYYHVVRQIVSAAGVQQSSQISINYAPSYQRLVFHAIRVIRGTELIDQLNLSRIRLVQSEEDLDRFLYSGLYIAYLPLEDVRPGDKIEYAYTIEGTNPVMDRQYGERLYFNGSNPIAHLYISLMSSEARPLYFRCFNQMPPPVRSSWQGKALYSWTFANRPVYKEASHVPVWFDGFPCVQVTTWADWKTVADWAVKDFASAGGTSGLLLTRLAAKWDREAGANDTAYVQAATRFVQDQIRYMGIEMGPYSHRPHAPVQVLKQRYGDCKDKSLLLVTLLRMRHIPAYVALVNADNGSRLDSSAPSASLFDHAIVNFQMGDSVYWIDPTVAYQRGGITRIATPDYGYALIVREGVDSLTPMRVRPPRHVDITERFALSKDNSAPGTLEVVTRYEGAAADAMRADWNASSQGSLQQSYLDYYNKLYTHVSLADSLRMSDDPEADIVTTREKYLLKEPWQTTDSVRKKTVFIAYAQSLSSELPGAVDENRKAPLALTGPVNMDYHIQVITPDEWPFTPSDDKIDRPAYRFRYHISRSGDTLRVDYAYRTFQDYIAAGATGLWNKDLKVITADLNLQMTRNGLVGEGTGKLSWLSLMIALASVALFGWMALKCWRYSPDRPGTPGPGPRPIGGWLILIAANVFLSPVVVLYAMATGPYFHQAIWTSLRMESRAGLGLCVVIMIAGSCFLLVCTVLEAVLLVKRRDIFPRIFILTLAASLALIVFDTVTTRHFFGTATSANMQDITRAVIYAAVWIPYIRISERVKNTFVVRYTGSRKETAVSRFVGEQETVPAAGADDETYGAAPGYGADTNAEGTDGQP